tara:strand:+ start:2018 stop:2494 length:477 start_codon:yes stop_codon:yes gene_type:complete
LHGQGGGGRRSVHTILIVRSHVHIEAYVGDPALMTSATVSNHTLVFTIKHFDDSGFATGRDEPTARAKRCGEYRAEITPEPGIDKSRNSKNIFIAVGVAAIAAVAAIIIGFSPGSRDIDDAYDAISATNAQFLSRLRKRARFQRRGAKVPSRTRIRCR